MEMLIKENYNKNHIGRMSDAQPEFFSNHIAFGWAGDYLKYMGYVYDLDMQECIDEPAECEFSIVIPVRNNPKPLRYTLNTCLQLEEVGEYEIVISDNSDYEDRRVEELCQEINDKRIRYYRTPFVLLLSKSFEYAYMHAKGDFILSMGADDGIFPWALRVIKILQNYMILGIVKLYNGEEDFMHGLGLIMGSRIVYR